MDVIEVPRRRGLPGIPAAAASSVVLVATLFLLELALRLATMAGSFFGFPLEPLDPAAPIRAAKGTDFSKSYLVFDADLGWTVGPSRLSSNGLYQSTAFGARSTGIASEPASGRRTWALSFGDSFTHGDDVPGEATWQHGLSSRLGRTVLNFGVPGYGVDQAFLRYRKIGAVWPSNVVLIGVMADNIGRHVNRYRPFISPVEKIFFAKPRFVIEGSALRPLPQPFATVDEYFAPDVESRLAELGKDDDWYKPSRYQPRPWDFWRTARVLRTVIDLRRTRTAEWRRLYERPEAVELTRRVILEFARTVRADGREPALVFFPDKTFCRDALDEKAPLSGPLLSSLASGGLRVIDLTEPLVRFFSAGHRLDEHFLPHYSRELNELVSQTLAEALADR